MEDYWQGRGIGLALTNMLVDEARERGIHFFYGLVLPENRRMLNLFNDLHLPEYERSEGSKNTLRLLCESKPEQRSPTVAKLSPNPVGEGIEAQ